MELRYGALVEVVKRAFRFGMDMYSVGPRTRNAKDVLRGHGSQKPSNAHGLGLREGDPCRSRFRSSKMAWRR